MFSALLNKLRRKKEFKQYEFRVVDFDLPQEGKVRYAQWLHPGEFGNEVKQESVNFYRQYVKPGDFIIDIGANEGDTTVPMAIAAGKAGLTLALEPNPHVYKVLKVNATLNPEITHIVPLNFAATSHDGDFTFGSGDPSYGNGGIVGFTHNQARNVRYQINVKGKNLENYLRTHYAEKLGKLTFIKIDAEGYDKEIIKTLTGIIRDFRPTLVTECFGPSTAEEKKELYTLLTGLNYDVYRLRDFLNTTAEQVDHFGGKETFDVLAVPRR
jgi:FkbM family methyltransferase